MERNKRGGTFNSSLITFIKQRREEEDWSIAETSRKIDEILAAWGETGRLGHRKTLSQIERGKRRIDAIELLAIASLFKIKLDGLIKNPSSED